MEMLDIADYKATLNQQGEGSFKARVIRDMNHRLQHCVPEQVK